ETAAPELAALIETQLAPRPDYAAMLRLTAASAMIDVSDGLSTDLGRIAAASGVGIDLDRAGLQELIDPLLPAARHLARSAAPPPPAAAAGARQRPARLPGPRRRSRWAGSSTGERTTASSPLRPTRPSLEQAGGGSVRAAPVTTSASTAQPCRRAGSAISGSDLTHGIR